jgi:hypothetical protein
MVWTLMYDIAKSTGIALRVVFSGAIDHFDVYLPAVWIVAWRHSAVTKACGAFAKPAYEHIQHRLNYGA